MGRSKQRSPISLTIRSFWPCDSGSIVEILERNGQYGYPNIEGPEAMERVAQCDAAVLLVAETNSKVVGCIRVTYDGSRAMIHLLSVHPQYHRLGIGTKLVASVIQILTTKGAPTVSVTATESSRGFWDKLGFKKLPVFLMLKEDLLEPPS
jgi:N-acetylglutamate synthase-like GNAT family acetyltransferase